MLNVEHGSKRFSNFGFSFFVDRKNPGPEDRNGEEGGTAVLHEDVHGLSTLLHLPHEVCVCVYTCILFNPSSTDTYSRLEWLLYIFIL